MAIMIIITNRNLEKRARKDEKVFGEHFNEKGCNEIRLATATKKGRRWKVDILVEPQDLEEENRPSKALFYEMQQKMKKLKRDCLFFVHGYNTSFKGVLEMADFFEKAYNLEVVAFTWPSNGGGLNGLPSYRSDKREAVASVGAFDRTLELLNRYLSDPSLKGQECGQSFNMIAHSMGNYLFKNLLKSSVYEGETLLFDNIILAAADVNNKGHEEWVDRIVFRRNLYICINEDDYALLASRAKFGPKQQARLGHWRRNLNSINAKYIDFTDAKDVKRSHTYFKDGIKNIKVKRFFQRAFTGRRAESGLKWDERLKMFVV